MEPRCRRGEESRGEESRGEESRGVESRGDESCADHRGRLSCTSGRCYIPGETHEESPVG